MDSRLTQFIRAHCLVSASHAMPVAEFLRCFYHFTPGAKESFPRNRVLSELTLAGFEIGLRDRIHWIAGLGPRGVYGVQHGSLCLSLGDGPQYVNA